MGAHEDLCLELVSFMCLFLRWRKLLGIQLMIVKMMFCVILCVDCVNSIELPVCFVRHCNLRNMSAFFTALCFFVAFLCSLISFLFSYCVASSYDFNLNNTMDLGDFCLFVLFTVCALCALHLGSIALHYLTLHFHTNVHAAFE